MRWFLYFGFVFLTSCGYHLGQGELTERYRTISVPYVDGDEYGYMTAALVKEISRSGGFIYQNSGADLTLCVVVTDYSFDNIGYRYDRKKNGKIQRDIIPVETRATILAEFSLIEAASGCVVLGPVEMKSSLDFDHDHYNAGQIAPSDGQAINIFSLGQLTDYDTAVDSVYKPLYLNLAAKIVDYINNAW